MIVIKSSVKQKILDTPKMTDPCINRRPILVPPLIPPHSVGPGPGPIVL